MGFHVQALLSTWGGVRELADALRGTCVLFALSVDALDEEEDVMVVAAVAAVVLEDLAAAAAEEGCKCSEETLALAAFLVLAGILEQVYGWCWETMKLRICIGMKDGRQAMTI